MKPTERTDTLVRALKQARALDLDKLYGSGIDVELHDYADEDRTHVERVTIHAEDAGPLREALIECLEKALAHRERSLKGQLCEINDVMKLTPTQKKEAT